MNVPALRTYDANQLALIRKTIAKDCNSDEFDLFIELCKRQGLDPFKKQIYAFVFKSKKKQPNDEGQWVEVEERKLTPVTSIDGYRAKAARQKDYRPDEKEPLFELSDEYKDEAKNPRGIVKCSITVHKFGPDKQWHPITGTARREEYAPIVEDGKWERGQGFVGNGNLTLDKKKPNWRKMPFIMLAKCAEAQALRKGWPEEFSGLYIEEEIDRSASNQTASEAADLFEQEERLKRIGGKNTIPVFFNITEGLKMIPQGQFADKVIEHLRTFEDPQEIEFWKESNRQGLQIFWAANPSEALDLKKSIEVLQKKIENQPTIMGAG